MDTYFEIRKTTHKNKKIWHIFENFRALENNSELPGYT